MNRLLLCVLALALALCVSMAGTVFAENVVPETASATVEPTEVPDDPDAIALNPTDVDLSTPEPTEVPAGGRLAGVVIGIDPGHQAHANNGKEPVSPGSKEKKAKVASGTAGVSTRVAEYVVNLQVGLKLRDALVAEGATVVMARETNDVDISNVERAQLMNEKGAQLFLRIHCNGSTNRKANGIGLYVRKSGGDVASAAYDAAKVIMPCMVEATGAREDGIFRRDNYSGLNWAEMPSILVEMGFMSNKEEDEKLNDPAYQDKLVAGMVEGVCRYFGDKTEDIAQSETENVSTGE